ncbi:hypothetical protein BH09MYX1_BH09MYX1_47030 [soil metagenome]
MRTARTLSIVFALALLPTLALAQSDEDKSLARSMGQEGQAALDKKDFRTAEDRFKRAIRVFDDAKAPVPPTLLLGFARGAAGNGHIIAAQEAYNRLIRTGNPPGAPAVFVAAVDDAKKEIDLVSARVGKVRITVSGCDSPKVTLDDAPMSSAALGISRPVDPGTHLVKATADGCKPGEATFTVAEGKETEASVTLTKDVAVVTPPGTPPTNTPPPSNPPPSNPPPVVPPPPSNGGSGGSALKTAGFVSLGVGGAGLILGAITGGIALGKAGTLKDACTTKNANGAFVCASDQTDAISSYKTMATVSTVGFIIGGIGIAAGVVMILVAPKNKEGQVAFIRPYLGVGEIGAFGAF